MDVKRYLTNQLVSFSRGCDKKLVNEISEIVNRMDRRAYILTHRLSDHMTKTYGLRNLVGRPLFSNKILLKVFSDFWRKSTQMSLMKIRFQEKGLIHFTSHLLYNHV